MLLSSATCDQAIKASGLDLKALAAYLSEGVTWTRLKDIATTSPAQGGLQLFRDTSQQCKDLFGTSPSAIIDTRPDTDLQFLKLLEGKEHLLHRPAVRDLEQRTLSTAATGAVLHLGDINKRNQRRVLQEILERCMFLLYHNQKHPMVAATKPWDELLKLAAAEILNLDISPLVLQRLASQRGPTKTLKTCQRPGWSLQCCKWWESRTFWRRDWGVLLPFTDLYQTMLLHTSTSCSITLSGHLGWQQSSFPPTRTLRKVQPSPW